jgi:hypothetical protein
VTAAEFKLAHINPNCFTGITVWAIRLVNKLARATVAFCQPNIAFCGRDLRERHPQRHSRHLLREIWAWLRFVNNHDVGKIASCHGMGVESTSSARIKNSYLLPRGLVSFNEFFMQRSGLISVMRGLVYKNNIQCNIKFQIIDNALISSLPTTNIKINNTFMISEVSSNFRHEILLSPFGIVMQGKIYVVR